MIRSVGFLVALILVAVGGWMMYYASVSLARDKITCPHFAMAAAGVISIAAKEWLYRVTRSAAVKSHSSALYANAWHHRSDALSSIAVVIGFIAMKFGFTHGDQVAAIAVGLMVVWVGVKIIGDALRELTEGAIDLRWRPRSTRAPPSRRDPGRETWWERGGRAPLAHAEAG